MAGNRLGLALAAWLLVLLPSLAAAQEEPSPYRGKSADEVLDEALKAVKMTRSDLEFEKQFVADSYRLHTVRDLLEKPLKLREHAESLCAGLARFHDYTNKLLGIAARETDVVPIELARKLDAAAFGEVLKAIFAKGGDSLDARRLKKAEEGFNTLPTAVQKMLVELLSAVAGGLEGIVDALAGLSAEDQALLMCKLPELLEMAGTSAEPAELEKILKLAEKVPRDRLFAAGMLVAEGIDTACRTLASLPVDKSWKTAVFYCDTPFGAIAVRGSGDDVHVDSGRMLLLLDLGGNDTHTGVAGGARGGKMPLSISIDLAGNDLYTSSEPFRQGAGLLGVGMLVDVAGDDTYMCGNFCQGCGVLGVGILRDSAGNDKLFADTCAQGAGLFGIGMLLDSAGNDCYYAALYAQAFGAPCGFGLLHDRVGNDLYCAGGKYPDTARQKDRYLSLAQGCGFGLRSLASGGEGVLMDSEGNDLYSADVFAQGTGYWFSIGILRDTAGHDVYSASQYAQGAGVHSSLGLLMDDDGSDKYASRSVSQGCGHDFAVGFLLDKKGNDSYSSADLSQGAGNANGIGFLSDQEGDDCYASLDDWYTQGSGVTKRDSGSIGIFLDLTGNDTYSSARSGFGANNSIWTKTTWGVGVDVETK